MAKSSKSYLSREVPQKPKKPYAEFPLTPHLNGSWCKNIRGKLHHFGRWGGRSTAC